MSNRNRRLSGYALVFACAAAIVAAALPSVTGATTSNQLRRVRGTVGYVPPSSTTLTPVFGRIDLNDDATAVTQAESIAELSLPDSSVVTLGAGTNIRVGAFTNPSAGPGSTIVVNNGTLRFDIKRPAGGRANYVFQTATSQIAVRGTIGLLSVINGITKVACIQCAADSVVVSSGGQTFALENGETLTVTSTGPAPPAPTTPDDTSGFGQSGVSTDAGGGAGVGAGAGGAIAGAAAAAAIAAVLSRPGNDTPAPTNAPVSPTPTPTPTASPIASASPAAAPTKSALPTTSPSPSASATAAGNVTITGGGRRGTESGGGSAGAPPAAATAGPGNVPLPSNRRVPLGTPQPAGMPGLPGTSHR